MDVVVMERVRAGRGERLPVGVYLLGFSLFAMGSAEFLLAGILPEVADGLHVSLSAAGFLITAFALGVVIGGPPFAVLSLRWPRRTTLAVTQAVFAASIVTGLLGGYQVLLVTRVIAGIAYAGFFAVASVTAIGLVTPDRNARASGVVVSGLSVAMVAGGPAGALLSHVTQWRGGFWAVAVLTVIGMSGCALGLPAAPESERDHPAKPSVARELATLRRPLIWSVFAITILTTAAYMVTFNYLAAMLTDITGLPEVWVPAVLALFGVGAFLGLSVGGRVSDRRPHVALLAGAVAIATLSVVMTAVPQSVRFAISRMFSVFSRVMPTAEESALPPRAMAVAAALESVTRCDAE